MSAYGAYGQLIGAGVEYEANDRERQRQRDLASYQEDSQNQSAEWERQSNQQLQDYLRGATAKRFASQRSLADQIGSPNRAAAGEAAAAGQSLDQARAAAMLRLQPVGDRSMTGGAPGFAAWQGAQEAQASPVLDARRALLLRTRAQRGMANYDTAALNNATDAGIDINRGANEQMQLSDLLSLRRQEILAQNQAAHRDTGPSQGYYNMMALSQALGAGGAALDAQSAMAKKKKEDEEKKQQQAQQQQQSASAGYQQYAGPAYDDPAFYQ